MPAYCLMADTLTSSWRVPDEFPYQKTEKSQFTILLHLTLQILNILYRKMFQYKIYDKIN